MEGNDQVTGHGFLSIMTIVAIPRMDMYLRICSDKHAVVADRYYWYCYCSKPGAVLNVSLFFAVFM